MMAEIRNDRISCPFRDDTATLRVSNHMHGVTIILGLVREAEALGRTLDHMYAIADLYRSLPALAALPWFRPHRRLICWCVQQIHERDFLSYCLTHVDWLVLRRLSRRDVQSRMADNRFRQLFWRELEREGIDAVEHIQLPFPDSLRNPLRNAAGDYRHISAVETVAKGGAVDTGQAYWRRYLSRRVLPRQINFLGTMYAGTFNSRNVRNSAGVGVLRIPST